MIVYKNTQRLFWKKWPYKLVLGEHSKRRSVLNPMTNRYLARDNENYVWSMQFYRWFKLNYSDCRIRRENHFSVFVSTEQQVKEIIDSWNKYVLEVWAPTNQTALALMHNHINDVVRAKPWHGEYSIRLVIPYTKELKAQGIDQIAHALVHIEREKWHVSGLFERILDSHFDSASGAVASARQQRHLPYPYGQTFYLYLKDSDDALMLKLQLSEWIERIERQRNPLAA